MVSPVFQPRFGEDTYPIGRLIVARARALGLSRSDLVHRFSYRDLGKGHKAFAEALRTGVVPAHRRKHLSSALEFDEAAVDSVIESTSRQRFDEWRARLLARETEHLAHFQPHLRRGRSPSRFL